MQVRFVKKKINKLNIRCEIGASVIILKKDLPVLLLTKFGIQTHVSAIVQFTQFNHVLQKGVPNRINNFKEDIKDSVALTHLVDAIAPKDAGVTTNPLKVS